MVGNFLSNAGGSRGVCEDLSARLLRAGWQVITTSSRPGRLARLLDMTRVALERRREYGVAQVDVYSGPAFFWGEWMTRLLSLLGKPFVVTLHGGNLPQFAAQWPRRVAAVLRRADRVTAPSEYLRRSLCHIRSDIELLPNPIDLNAYGFRTREHPQPRLVWLRAMHRIYNPTLAAETSALLVRHYPNLSLKMYGPDKGDGSGDELESRICALGLARNVQWCGSVPKAVVSTVLAEGDIFLNTTNVDNTPVSVIEAMASGMCIVSTNVGGMPDLVADGRDGFLVRPEDPAAMAVAVKRILGEPELGGRLSANARRRVECFDWRLVLPRWEALLAEVSTPKA